MNKNVKEGKERIISYDNIKLRIQEFIYKLETKETFSNIKLDLINKIYK